MESISFNYTEICDTHNSTVEVRSHYETRPFLKKLILNTFMKLCIEETYAEFNKGKYPIRVLF